MSRRVIRILSLAIAFLAGLSATTFGVIAVRANDRRWHEGPTVVVLSPTHGLHEMDVLLIVAATGSAAIALIAAIIARR